MVRWCSRALLLFRGYFQSGGWLCSPSTLLQELQEEDRDAKLPYLLVEQGVEITRCGHSLASATRSPSVKAQVHMSICSSKEEMKQAGFVMGNFEEAGNTLKHERMLRKTILLESSFLGNEDNLCSEEHTVLQERGWRCVRPGKRVCLKQRASGTSGVGRFLAFAM